MATENNSTHKSEKKTLSQIFTTPIWLLINPLLLIEVISNNHNDLWMIVPAMASFLLLDNKKKKNGRRVLFSALLLFFSTQIKFATLVLIPFWLYMAGGREFIEIIKMKCRCQVWLAKTHEWVENYFFDLIALAMFIPLFTNRSQMFHPWYLTWSLVWLPFCRWQWSRISLVAFSVSATLRYLPFLIVGNYSETVLTQQKIVTFAGAGIIILCFIIFYSWQKKSGSVIE